MIAFSIGPIDIYRYGIFYFIGFLAGYGFFHWITKKKIFGILFPRVQHFFEHHIDDMMICIFLGVMIGGRLGHVIIYNLQYYVQHPNEIVQVRKGGMSFIGGMIGVTLALFTLVRRKKLSYQERVLVFDILLVMVPFGIMLGRIGNFLNQELYGIVVSNWLPKLGYPIFSLLNDIGIFHVYSHVDHLLRVNTNFLSAFFEGLVLFVINLSIIRHRVKTKKPQPGKIVAVFLMGYSFIRFILEYVRADAQLEFQGPLTTSQRFFVIFFLLGIVMFVWQKRKNRRLELRV